MRRREILVYVGAATILPRSALAQTPGRTYRIGILFLPPRTVPALRALIDELGVAGFTEGKNLIIDERGIGVRPDKFATVARELALSNVDVFICASGAPAISGARQATKTIPIVGLADNMVQEGYVESLANGSGNTTGVSILADELDGKRQEILMDLLPKARRMAVLADPTKTPQQLRALQEAAQRVGIELGVQRLEKAEDVWSALDTAKAQGAEALNLLASPFYSSDIRPALFARARALRLPTISQWAESAAEGGVLAYGPSLFDIFRQLARMAVKILRGTKAAQLPVEQPTKFKLAINPKAANEMGITVPASLLQRADEVVE
jgi:putative tryptophan/tyrosine transport system substrate-binding protein